LIEFLGNFRLPDYFSSFLTMDDAVCERCGGRFESGEVYSWGLCKDCDEAVATEVKRLKIRRTLYGFGALLFLFLLLCLMITYMIGTDSHGKYHLVTPRSVGSPSSDISPSALLSLAVFCFIGESIFAPMYLLYRQRTNRMEREAFGLTF